STNTPTPATTNLSLHDALPISIHRWKKVLSQPREQSEGEEAGREEAGNKNAAVINKCFEQPAICAPDTLKTTFEPSLKPHQRVRSEEHTSELQSRGHLVCRLLL